MVFKYKKHIIKIYILTCDYKQYFHEISLKIFKYVLSYLDIALFSTLSHFPAFKKMSTECGCLLFVFPNKLVSFYEKKSTFCTVLAYLVLEQPTASLRINVYPEVNISGGRSEFQSC